MVEGRGIGRRGRVALMGLALVAVIAGCAGSSSTEDPSGVLDPGDDPVVLAPEPLEGRAWTLISYVHDGQDEDVPEGIEITALFEADEGKVGVGSLSGSGGCNQYGGSYVADDGAISLGHLAWTEMACAPEIMVQEMAFLGVISSVTKYATTTTHLTLTDATGSESATFQR
ncbi:META domain-containing protein [Candidatus Poribacteria bacterium]|jgi:heat shock protein HslJ|nr:META domain-containing protein [Candidatus Poribacteria bacterium]MBT5533631.1 META domain-containing protein [Candidatus Poribacteria bacterium]MBT5713281.1 META domain-containing protein [Candidatus Poribacteria bacterium]MBT7097827.1 META domain-containing protein [Candidatus Poribacteria bacterium]MBT7805941.1 META domain-containing protein [Candidatus Poribacteria bacterium]